MSNTCQAAAEPFGRGELQRTKGVIHVAWVHTWSGGRDGVGFAPQLLAVTNPGVLVFGQVWVIRRADAHGQS